MTKLPIGIYDLALTREIEREIKSLGDDLGASIEDLDPADSNILLTRHLAERLRQSLQSIPTKERTVKQAEIINRLLALLGSELGEEDELLVPAKRLASVHPIHPIAGPQPLPDTLIPLGQNDLLVNARGETSVSEALASEIESADRIDLLCAFIKWSGLRLIQDGLRDFIDRGGQLRVITTTYIGATQRKAVDRLVELGADVRVSYLDTVTRLHAKAWLFYRKSGFSTAYIGSSNLSLAALVDGLEWNVRVTSPEAPGIIEKFEATFESYWESPDFESYDPEIHHEKFDKALRKASRSEDPVDFTFFDLTPYGFQQEILDKLAVERHRHERWKNLVVAATGTGKTVIAAFDYRRLSEELNDGRPLKLLFIAHRKEILDQSLATFRTVLRDGSFGEKYVGGHRPSEWNHVFASIQSLQNLDLGETPRDLFDVVIVDEFHHSEAPTYRRILEHFTPRVLLGLTATPERMDGQSVLGWFDDRIAAELRLWDALDRGLLVPFHYFGIGDTVDLSTVSWSRGRYDTGELQNLYTADDARIRLILRELEEKVVDVNGMRALGFCVGVDHARMMADRFNQAGIASRAILGLTDLEERDAALRDLRNGKLNCVFAVDIFNEGVDIPQVDTVLFLRPTESATVFLQQLGRGLRRTEGKDCLTVLDFIGNANRKFRFDQRYRAILGGTRNELKSAVEADFPFLPPGCAMHLDEIAREYVIRNLKQSLGRGVSGLVEELRAIGEPVSLEEYLRRVDIELEEIYDRSNGSWTRIQREAGMPIGHPADSVADAPDPSWSDTRVEISETQLLNGIARTLHIDESRRLDFLRGYFSRPRLTEPEELSLLERRMLEGFLNTLISGRHGISHGLAALTRHPDVRLEIAQVLDILEERAIHETVPLQGLPSLNDYPEEIPLSLHARYTREEIFAAVSFDKYHREGPLWHPETNTNYLFVTLQKSEKDYSPSTMYRDYAISPDRFHWESQSMIHEETPTGQRYINHESEGSHVILLVREANKRAGKTLPFTVLGPATYVSHSGAKPMAIVWHLHHPMPLDLFRIAKVAGSA